jgi:hypothetical protein
MIRVTTVRFFLAVSPPPAWMRIAFAAAMVVAWVTLWLNPADVDSAFGTILLLQMFSASSGFATSAARGFFDPVLVSGRSMGRIAYGHLASSTLPGLIAWSGVTVFALAVGSHAALSPHRHAAVLIVSAVAWAAGLALPRLTSGALWSMVLVAFALSRNNIGDAFVIVQSVSPGFSHAVAAATAFVVCPFLLLGDFPAAADPLIVSLALAIAVACVAVGVQYITRREYSLVEPV